MAVETFKYDNEIVRKFGIATIFWGIIGFLVGLTVALKLIYPSFLGFIPELSYGRLRPLHTNAVIFAFAGNAIFYGVYYSLPRLCKASMWSNLLSKINFWGWQAIIVSAVITLPLGITTSKEYAELEWPIDIAITIVWVIFGINMMMTIWKRREKHLYVAIWFYIATFVTVAVLHMVNSIEIPATFLKSYPVYAGVQDALVQWWYGHNAVAFFLTTPFLGIMYYFIPKAANRPIFSYRLSIVHFWFMTLGAIFYVIPMYWGGITQSLMWKEFNAEGMLQYPNFLETVQQIIPMYALRAVGGTLFIIGAVISVFNLWKTAASGQFLAAEEDQAQPIVDPSADSEETWHRRLESRPIQLTALTLVVILIGGIVEYVPTALIDSNVPTIASVKPYTPLEVEGRDIYIAEGCNNCHSQMIRPFRSETERYGEYSKAGEFVYDHPFLWGSKRTGPDLHRQGGKYPDSWHLRHMHDPESTSPGSIMPAYPWLLEQDMDKGTIAQRIAALRGVGVPYVEGYEDEALADLEAQAEEITQGLHQAGFKEVDGIAVTADKKIIAMIAYLQRLGIDIKGNNNPFEGLPSSKAIGTAELEQRPESE